MCRVNYTYAKNSFVQVEVVSLISYVCIFTFNNICGLLYMYVTSGVSGEDMWHTEDGWLVVKGVGVTLPMEACYDGFHRL